MVNCANYAVPGDGGGVRCRDCFQQRKKQLRQQQQQLKGAQGAKQQQAQQGHGKRKATAAAAAGEAQPQPQQQAAASGAGGAKRRKSSPAWDAQRLYALVETREQGFRTEPGVSSKGTWDLGKHRADTKQLLADFGAGALTNKWNAFVAKAGATADGLSDTITSYGGGGQTVLSAELLARIRQQKQVEQHSGL